MRKISLSTTEHRAINDNSEKLDFMINTVIKPKFDPIFTSLDNVSFLRSETLSATTEKLIYDIGLENLYFFMQITASTTVSITVGLCDSSTPSTNKISTSLTGLSNTFGGDTVNGYDFKFTGDMFILSRDNKLISIFSDCTVGNPSSNSYFFILDEDNYGDKFVFYGGMSSSYNQLYYGNDEGLALHTVDANHVNNAKEGQVWVSNTPIFLNNSLKATTTGLLKICNMALGTNSAQCGTLIDVEGVTYRKLNYCWWTEDNE